MRSLSVPKIAKYWLHWPTWFLYAKKASWPSSRASLTVYPKTDTLNVYECLRTCPRIRKWRPDIQLHATKFSHIWNANWIKWTKFNRLHAAPPPKDLLALIVVVDAAMSDPGNIGVLGSSSQKPKKKGNKEEVVPTRRSEWLRGLRINNWTCCSAVLLKMVQCSSSILLKMQQ